MDFASKSMRRMWAMALVIKWKYVPLRVERENHSNLLSSVWIKCMGI